MIEQLYIPAFWFSSNNFGDNLTHFLIREISGKTPVLCDMNSPELKFMVTGSIMSVPVTNASVWGCGIAFRNAQIPLKMFIWAVRGKYTGERLKELGMSFNEVYGDPALLLPRLYGPKHNFKKYKLGIIPHYVDTSSVYQRLGMTDKQLFDNFGIKIIDVLTDVRTFVDQVNQCERVISSTLHGIITAHSYGIPCEWVTFSNNIGGDGTKYMDYYSSVQPKENFRADRPIDYRGSLMPKKLLEDSEKIEPLELKIDLDALWQSCPFKK